MQVNDVATGAGVEIIHAQHIVALLEQAITQVGAKKASTTGDQYSFCPHAVDIKARGLDSDMKWVRPAVPRK